MEWRVWSLAVAVGSITGTGAGNRVVQIMGQALKHFSQPQEKEQQQQHQDDDLTKLPSPLLSQLPDERLLYNIFPYLTYLDLCHLSQINKYFKNLIELEDVDHL
ncbi:unnamed protein product [Didymodactylos carnosus]|uniref:F-box domain-containing protein n=1 Tax=Didymodactylos carnosus TaxID=1234261 RepID=A0A815I7P7_9BILA|nr:unnamed protein product [Didymodactylos carnosus]CAF4242448.1 unnamed protein product [Didymodactylos carnosus]